MTQQKTVTEYKKVLFTIPEYYCQENDCQEKDCIDCFPVKICTNCPSILGCCVECYKRLMSESPYSETFEQSNFEEMEYRSCIRQNTCNLPSHRIWSEARYKNSHDLSMYLCNLVYPTAEHDPYSFWYVMSTTLNTHS